MRGRASPLCDACGAPTGAVTDGVVRLRFDADGRLVQSGVYHKGCPCGSPAPGESVEVIPIAVAASSSGLARLFVLARAHDGASIGRLARKLRRLAPSAARSVAR